MRLKNFAKSRTTYPAKDPPTHGSAAGENAGALPAVDLAAVDDEGGGEGLLRILM